MGYTTASALAQSVPDTDYLTVAITAHLRGNCFPPVPNTMVPICVKAVQLVNEGDGHALITLPEGVTFRGEDKIVAFDVIHSYHLDVFLDEDDDPDEYDYYEEEEND